MTWIRFAILTVVLFLLTGAKLFGGPINRVTNGDFEQIVSANSLGANGGYFCQAGATCTSNVVGWSSICRNGACGGGGTPDSILFPGTNGSAFNGNRGLWAKGQSGLLTNVGVPNSPTGGNFIAFDGDPTYNASISQTITGLTPGARYAVSFCQAAAQQSGLTGATTNYWQVTFANQTQNSGVLYNNSRGWVPWLAQTMVFTVPTTSTGSEVLTFLSMGSPKGLPPVVLLDGISLTDAPEPEAFALVGLALIGIPYLRRKKR